MSDLKTIKFEIVTPEKVVLKEEITQVSVPTKMGELTILPDHIPLVAILQPGVIEVKTKDGKMEIISVSNGLLEVLNSKIVILVDEADRAAELDEKIVEEARVKAETAKLEAKNRDDVEFADIAAKLEVELARSKALSRWRRIKNLDK